MSAIGGSGGGVLERLLRSDRRIVIAGLVGVAGLAWAYTAHLAARMDGMDGMGAGPSMGGATTMMPQMHPWGPGDVLLTFVMWAVMMAAMMVPAAAPMVLLFAAAQRKRAASRSPVGVTGVFLLGYLLVWSAYSAGATALQWALHSAALLSPGMVSTSDLLGGTLLVAAGAFQLTPVKEACLRHCRSPLHFLMGEWRDGARGALRMGVKHGAYCVGCCWVLMALLFVAGVMNLLWVAAITILVLVERVAPRGDLVGRVAGVLLVVAGLAMAGGAALTR